MEHTRVHIGAALLGHLNVQATRGYIAVFEEDVVRHYQEFLDRRRARRPAGEYRQPTGEEWAEFEEHFDKRKVELGSCGRPYGPRARTSTPASAARCYRSTPRCCPAWTSWRTACWRGEVDGIDLTLTFLRGKRDQARPRRRERDRQPGHARAARRRLPHQQGPATGALRRVQSRP